MNGGNGQDERGNHVFKNLERQDELFHIFMFIRVPLEQTCVNRRTRRKQDGTD